MGVLWDGEPSEIKSPINALPERVERFNRRFLHTPRSYRRA